MSFSCLDRQKKTTLLLIIIIQYKRRSNNETFINEKNQINHEILKILTKILQHITPFSNVPNSRNATRQPELIYRINKHRYEILLICIFPSPSANLQIHEFQFEFPSLERKAILWKVEERLKCPRVWIYIYREEEEEEGAILFESVCDSRKRKRWVKKRRGGRWLPVNGTKNHANLLSLGKAFRFDPSSCHVPFHLYPSECLACHLMHTRICIRSLLFICRYLLCLL